MLEKLTRQEEEAMLAAWKTGEGSIKAISEKTSSISFQACGNTLENMAKAENKPIRLVSQTSVVKSGVVRVMELQEQGWSYVRP